MPLRGWHTHTDRLGGRGGVGVDRANLPAGASWQIRAATGSGRQGQHEVAHPLDTRGSELGRAAVSGRARWARWTRKAGLVAGHVRGQDRRIEAAMCAAAAVGSHAGTVPGRGALADLNLRALAREAAVTVDDEAIATRSAASHRHTRELAPTLGTCRTHVLRTRRARAGHASARVDARIAIRGRVGRAIAARRGRGRAVGVGVAGRERAAGTYPHDQRILRRAGTTGGEEHEVHDEEGSHAHVDQEKSTGRAAV